MHILSRIFNNKKSKSKSKLISKDHEKLKTAFFSKLHKASKKNDAAFIDAIKEFFSERFNIRYEFTFDELISLIEKKKIRKEVKTRLKSILLDIESSYYSTDKLDKPKLKQFVSDLRPLINEL